jgi:hypothetical protein
MKDAGEALKLELLQRDAIVPQIDAFLAAVTDPAARAPYAALRDAVEQLEVPAEMTDRLGALAELALTSGRVRASFGPGAALALWSLYQRTPRGRVIADSVAALNRALQPLAGQPLEQVSAVARAPGAYALTIKTGQCQIVLAFEASGVRVESLEIG